MNPYVQYMYSYPHKTAYGALEGIHLHNYAAHLSGSGHGLYLHIPFCETKCGYCNLFSVTGQDTKTVDRYLDTVVRQINQYREVLVPYQTSFSDLTLGGGTPLLLTPDQLERVFRSLESFSFSKDRTCVVETAPNQTIPEKLRLLKDVGVTRVSMGVQSFWDEELKTLGRWHSSLVVRKALELLKSFYFPCVNLDFIYGIPGQSTASLLSSLKTALTYEPDELFLYPLYVKHGAGMTAKLSEGMVLNPELALSQYWEASAFLRSEGFRQDSMRRFVRIAADKKRTFSDCGFGTSLALGCGGRSYLGNLHFCTLYAITRKTCLTQLESFMNTKDFTAITHGYLLSDEEEKRRYVIRHLFIYPGLDTERYEAYFKCSVLNDFPILGDWLDMGWLEWTSDYLALTDEGLSLSDYLGPQLISSEVRTKMDAWEVSHGQ